jgi:hypothetical protein
LHEALCADLTTTQKVKRADAAVTLARLLVPGDSPEYIDLNLGTLAKLGHETVSAMAAAVQSQRETRNYKPPAPEALLSHLQTMRTVIKALAAGVLQLERATNIGNTVIAECLQATADLAVRVASSTEEVAASHNALAQQLTEQQPETQRLIAAAVAPLQKSIQAVQTQLASSHATAAAAATAMQSAQTAAARGQGYAAAAFRGAARNTQQPTAVYPPPPPLPLPPTAPPPAGPPRKRTDMEPGPGRRFVRLTLARGGKRAFGATSVAARQDIGALLDAHHVRDTEIGHCEIQYRRAPNGQGRDEVIAYVAELPGWAAAQLVQASRAATDAGLSGWLVRWHLSSTDFATRSALRTEFQTQLADAKHVQFFPKIRSVDINGTRYTLPAPPPPVPTRPTPPLPDPARPTPSPRPASPSGSSGTSPPGVSAATNPAT